MNKFQNFHVKHQGGRDSWLRDAFNDSCFRGAYMTDIIKNDTSSRQSRVDLSSDNIFKNIKEFEEELRFIQCNDPYIIALGDEANRNLTEYSPKYAKNIHSMPHYARWGIKKEYFIASANKLAK